LDDDANANNNAAVTNRRDNMFQELNEMYLIVSSNNNNNNNNNNADDVNRDSAFERASAELHLYKREPALLLQREEGVYNNPLDWWKVKQQQFPLLSKIAIKLLAIPATSAPSERVFSAAGLTIANERSRLDPSHANELVFLHEAKSALKKFDEQRELIG
jgi:hypothetical protein